MNFTLYNPDNGCIIGHLKLSDPSMAESNLVGRTYIEGYYNDNEYYIDQGQPVLLPNRPIDGRPYQFDYATKTWVIDVDVLRQQRNILLSAVDQINPVWYSTLTADQQAELQAYRRALLDVPQQSGFPTDVTWPAKPTWLP